MMIIKDEGREWLREVGQRIGNFSHIGGISSRDLLYNMVTILFKIARRTAIAK
jgi:hypothetical protein